MTTSRELAELLAQEPVRDLEGLADLWLSGQISLVKEALSTGRYHAPPPPQNLPVDPAYKEYFSVVNTPEFGDGINMELYCGTINTGHILFTIDHKGRTYNLTRFYPYDEVPSLKGTGLGLGPIFHTICLEELSNIISDEYTVKHRPEETSDYGMKYFEKLDEAEGMSLSACLTNVREYTISHGFYSTAHLDKIEAALDDIDF